VISIRPLLGIGAAMGIAALAMGSAYAQAPINLRAIGYTSNLYLWSEVEKPFYETQITPATNGRLRVEAVPHDLAGMRGTELLGLLQNGTLAIASANVSYMAGDDPRFEGIDLAGFALTVGDARKATEAYRAVLARLMEQKFNTRLLGLGPLPSQVFWCRTPISGVADLRGKKVRVFNATLSDFVNGAGGTTVTMPFVEVVPALQRGIADCAVTGTTSGNFARWPEVTTHLYPMIVGWSMVFWAANNDLWRRLPADVRTATEAAYRTLEDRSWAVQEQMDGLGIRCSTGQSPCEHPQAMRATMTLVPVSSSDMDTHARILRDNVLPRWAARCGRACVEEWNGTVGRALNLAAPMP
jgi:TRAP-type C4-dicarboxylate transport system substrate-binding protein